jgi:hypothetical protein
LSQALTQDQQRCLREFNDSSHHYCFGHRTVETVLSEWNPHAILLTLCCMQLLVCISKTQYNRETKRLGTGDDEQQQATIHFPINYGVAIAFILLFVILLITGLKHADLVQYPTVLTIAVLLGALLWYALTFDEYAEDTDWNLLFHMLAISVPLAVLSLATTGVRLWQDVLAHAVMLSAAGLALWLQNLTTHPWTLQIARLLTIALPTGSLSLAHMQQGTQNNNMWPYALMGCAGLLPLYVFTVVLPDPDEHRQNKLKLRMAYLCTGGALLSLVVNLAMFNTPTSS